MFVLFLQENEKLSRIYKQECDKMDEFKDILEEKELKDYNKKYKYFILIRKKSQPKPTPFSYNSTYNY